MGLGQLIGIMVDAESEIRLCLNLAEGDSLFSVEEFYLSAPVQMVTHTFI